MNKDNSVLPRYDENGDEVPEAEVKLPFEGSWHYLDHNGEKHPSWIMTLQSNGKGCTHESAECLTPLHYTEINIIDDTSGTIWFCTRKPEFLAEDNDSLDYLAGIEAMDYVECEQDISIGMYPVVYTITELEDGTVVLDMTQDYGSTVTYIKVQD